MISLFSPQTASMNENHKLDWKRELWKEREGQVSHDFTRLFWLQTHPLLTHLNITPPLSKLKMILLRCSSLRFTVNIVFSIFYTANIGFIKEENTWNCLQLRLPVFLFVGSTCSSSPKLNPRPLLQARIKGVDWFRGTWQRHGRKVPQPHERRGK